MQKFLLKGILRDKNRSLIPIIIVALGVMLTVFASSWLRGVFHDMIDITANYETGHVKLTTRAYAESTQAANDLALLDVNNLVENLQKEYPTMDWVQRTHFGGLLDVPDTSGETRGQGPAVGFAIDLFSPDTKEPERMNIPKSIVKGALPQNQGEALISELFAEKYNIKIGDEVTLFGATMYSSMMFYNFIVAGTVKFGHQAMDRGAIIIDIADAQTAFDMYDASGEILGFFSEEYDTEKAEAVKTDFNAKYSDANDEFSPVMAQLRDFNGLDVYLYLMDMMSAVFIIIFVLAMSIVLWNTGLLGGLRRYSEFGIRLAMGEEKKHIFGTLIYEALLIGIIGSIIGTVLGLGVGFYLQSHPLVLGESLQQGSIMMPSAFRAIVGGEAYYIGFIPGVLAMVVGNALSGLGIYKRKTAQLFKELEV